MDMKNQSVQKPTIFYYTNHTSMQIKYEYLFDITVIRNLIVLEMR